ncbi:MAG: ureidoglycolate lyase [Pseudomonadota bacterium]
MLKPEPLNRAAFKPFGDVIETAEATSYPINDGMCTRFHDLAAVDVDEDGGRPLINLFRSKPWPLPLTVSLLERHPKSSQAFVPLSGAPFLVVVAPPGDAPTPGLVRAFASDGRQGVNFHRGVWHHPLIAIGDESDFLVVDRGAEDENCDLHHFPSEAEPLVVTAQSGASG